MRNHAGRSQWTCRSGRCGAVSSTNARSSPARAAATKPSLSATADITTPAPATAHRARSTGTLRTIPARRQAPQTELHRAQGGCGGVAQDPPGPSSRAAARPADRLHRCRAVMIVVVVETLADQRPARVDRRHRPDSRGRSYGGDSRRSAHGHAQRRRPSRHDAQASITISPISIQLSPHPWPDGQLRAGAGGLGMRGKKNLRGWLRVAAPAGLPFFDVSPEAGGVNEGAAASRPAGCRVLVSSVGRA